MSWPREWRTVTLGACLRVEYSLWNQSLIELREGRSGVLEEEDEEEEDRMYVMDRRMLEFDVTGVRLSLRVMPDAPNTMERDNPDRIVIVVILVFYSRISPVLIEQNPRPN